MAPQQNSTFIEDDCISKVKLPSSEKENYTEDDEEEIIRCYSPILPLLNAAQLSELERRDRQIMPIQNEVPQTKQNKHSIGKSYTQHRDGDGDGNGNGYHIIHATQNALSRRSRSVSVRGANSTMGQEQKEITIWVDNEPRYVSGVTKKTTCNDIIKALIDDEVENGNYAFLRNDQKQHKHPKDGGNGVCATSRDYSDYVITESWRGIERSYDGNMTILPLWNAWNRVHNELRLRLRHQSEIRDLIPHPKPTRSQHNGILRKYLNKLTRLWRKDKFNPQPLDRPSKFIELKENRLPPTKSDIPDEILFVILPDKIYETERKEALQPIPENSNSLSLSPTEKLHSRRSSKLSKRKSTRVSRKKYLLRGISGVNANNNCIRRRQSSTVNNPTIRFRLAQKTSEIDALYAREYALTRELSKKCKLYRLQNQIYSNPDQQWNVSIGQVQRKIENYAKEIVRTEHELLELKNEIKQDISLINNLKRMTLERRTTDERKVEKKMINPCLSQSPTLKVPPVVNEPAVVSGSSSNKEMQFVDNIYEFCDNNASMLV